MLSQTLALEQARSVEAEFDWIRAADLYEQARSLAQAGETGSILDAAKLEGRIAICYTRAAFQTKESGEYRRLLRLAIKSYEAGEKILDEILKSKDSEELRAESILFRAKGSIIRSWLAAAENDFESKKALLSDSLQFAIQALNACEGHGEILKTADCRELILGCLVETAVTEHNGKSWRTIIDSALKYGQKLVETLSASLTPETHIRLFRAYYLISWFCSAGMDLFESEEKRKNLDQLANEYWKKSEELEKRIDDIFALSEKWAYDWGYLGPKEAARICNDILPKALRTRDNLLIVALCTKITYGIRWSMNEEENPEKIAGLLLELECKFGEVWSRLEFGLVGPYPIALASASYNMISSFITAAQLEIDSEKKRELLDKALALGKEATNRLTNFPANGIVATALATILALKADQEIKTETKRAMLDEAIVYSKNALAFSQEFEPNRSWNVGIGFVDVASLQFRRSNLDQDTSAKIDLLRQAIETSSKGVSLMLKEEAERKIGVVAKLRIAQRLEEQSLMLSALNQLTNETLLLDKKFEILQQAKDIYSSANLMSRVAETSWESGIVLSLLFKHNEAAKSYEEASQYFERAAEKIPKLSEYYSDYSSYMCVWAQVEKARHSHLEEEFQNSKKHYENAADLCEKSKTWKIFAFHFRACAILEEAEEAESVSRGDITADVDEAIKRFESASQLFAQSSQELKVRAGEILNQKERENVQRLVGISSVRENYCLARIQIEKARMHYRNGERSESIHEYSSAIEILERIAVSLRTESERKEIEAIVTSCKAWQKVQEAETYASPKSYSEAADLFSKTFESVGKKRAALVAVGNANYCMALSSGLQFKQSSKLEDYTSAKTRLSEAAEDYSKAGFETAAQWFRATDRTLDAYVYMNNALKEVEPEKRTKNYLAAEKVLESAASIYENAGYPAKRDDILSVLKKVREEKEFTMSLSEIFAASNVISNTASLAIPTNVGDQPAGLSEFQGANLGLAVAFPDEVRAGEEFEIKIDLINTGKKVAFLHKIEGLIPKGTTLVEPDTIESENENFSAKPSTSRINGQNGVLLFGGKKLQPFAIEPLSFRVKPDLAQMNNLEFNPKVSYSDESGKLSSKALGAASQIVVSTPILQGFRFEGKRTEALFNYLVDSFVDDYMNKKFHSERSGWRTLAEIAQHTGIARSTLYGSKGKGGAALELKELLKRGLIESRIFSGERGRGGEIMRFRVSYEKEPIKEYVTNRVRKTA